MIQHYDEFWKNSHGMISPVLKKEPEACPYEQTESAC
jgi:hypothetical protein